MKLKPATLLALCLVVLRVCVPAALAQEHFVFTSFRGNGEDGLHLAISTNGYHWTALNGGRSFLKSTVEGYGLMRDPCLAQGPDGTFHLVWTTGWTVDKAKTIGYASSQDLIRWSEQKGIVLMENEPGTRNLWAPEIFYDAQAKHWLIFWSSTVTNKFKQTAETGDDGYNHRIYCTTTPDFKTFTPSKLFYDPGFNAIDATMLEDAGTFYLFFKDERRNPVKKNLRYATALNPQGPFTNLSEPFTRDWVEGPSAIKIKDEYIVYFDHYVRPHYYGAVRSRDLKNWEECSKEMSFPQGQRHGTVLRIPAEIARNLPR